MAEAAEQELIPVRRGSINTLPRIGQELDRFFGSRWPSLFEWDSIGSLTKMPSIDVLDRENEICVRAEVPGFTKDQVDVSVNHNSLTIKAQSSSESKEEDGDYYRQEMTRGYLARTVSLPSEVDGDKAKATLNDGVLEVTVPKAASSKRQRVKID